MHAFSTQLQPLPLSNPSQEATQHADAGPERRPVSVTPEWVGVCTDEAFIAMLSDYRSSGGLARLEEALQRRMALHGADLDWLCRLTTRHVVSFDWQGARWVPMFQFRADMSVKAELATVLGELLPVFDEWEVAQWFAKPNVWLTGLRPAELLETDTRLVLEAARTDRYIAAG